MKRDRCKKPLNLTLGSLLLGCHPDQGHLKIRYEFFYLHHTSQKLVPETHHFLIRILPLVFNLDLFLSSLHFYFFFFLSCHLCTSPTSPLILFSSDTILPHLPTPSLHYVKEKSSHNFSSHSSLHFVKMSKSCSFHTVCKGLSFSCSCYETFFTAFAISTPLFSVRIAQILWTLQTKSPVYIVQWH